MATEPIRLSPVQARRKAVLLVAILAVLALLAVSRSAFHGEALHRAIQWIGGALILICIVGRCWCSLYIGGRKINTLTRTGPYSISRNPLYVFSFIGAAGAMAQSGSLVLTAAGAFICWLVFRLVVRKEERLLTSIYGEVYQAYLHEVPRFWPRFSQWRNVETLEILPRRVAMTLYDGLTFLLAIPLALAFEAAQDRGVVPVLLTLP